MATRKLTRDEEARLYAVARRAEFHGIPFHRAIADAEIATEEGPTDHAEGSWVTPRDRGDRHHGRAGRVRAVRHTLRMGEIGGRRVSGHIKTRYHVAFGPDEASFSYEATALGRATPTEEEELRWCLARLD